MARWPAGFAELTIRQLRALAAVQQRRSVTAAAKQLHLTQPAVTLQLRNLQALAGLPLIQRTGDGMLLTDAGREVLALAERIEAAIADCETSLDMMAGKTAGRISIGAVSTAKYFVPFMIAGFSQAASRTIEIKLTIGNRQEIGTALRGYDLDFAIMGRPPADIDMDVRLIGDHPHVIIAPTGHRLARKSRHRAGRPRRRDLPDPRAGLGHARPDGAIVRDRRRSPEDRHGDEQQRDHQAGGDRRARHRLHLGAHGRDRTRRAAAGRCSTSSGLPVVRQWFVLSRKDKILLPPAQADSAGKIYSNRNLRRIPQPAGFAPAAAFP